MASKIPPVNAALETLENYLMTNHLPANSKIPSERKLCEMWGMNRTTLRIAVNRLVDEGKLYRKKGAGTYVADPKWTRNVLGVDSLASSIKLTGIPLTTKILSQRIIECNKQISKHLYVPLGNKIFELIRLRKIDGQPCIIETTYIDLEQCPGFDQYDFEKSSMYSVFENIYHKEIVSGNEKISVTYVTEDEANLLDIKAGAPVFFATGVTLTSDNTPLEYYKTLFRADRFRFVSLIKHE